jgi:integrase
MRRARSLFSPKILRHLQLAIPSVKPFDGVEFEPRQSMKYRSRLDVGKLIEAANETLKPLNPECYAIFLLAAAAGLRRKEIDLLEWASFRWEENVIRIQPTKFFHPKSEDSIGDIQIDNEILAIFREYRATVKGPFVIPSRLMPKTVLRGDHYRCNTHFERLAAWLRLQGVTEQKTASHASKGVRYLSQPCAWHPCCQQSIATCGHHADEQFLHRFTYSSNAGTWAIVWA